MGKKHQASKEAARDPPSEAYYGSNDVKEPQEDTMPSFGDEPLRVGFHESKVLLKLESGKIKIINFGGHPDRGEPADEHWSALLRRY